MGSYCPKSVSIILFPCALFIPLHHLYHRQPVIDPIASFVSVGQCVKMPRHQRDISEKATTCQLCREKVTWRCIQLWLIFYCVYCNSVCCDCCFWRVSSWIVYHSCKTTWLLCPSKHGASVLLHLVFVASVVTAQLSFIHCIVSRFMCCAKFKRCRKEKEVLGWNDPNSIVPLPTSITQPTLYKHQLSTTDTTTT